MNLKILNSREKKRLAGDLAGRYAANNDVLDAYDVLAKGGDAWVASRGCLEADLGGLKVDSIGLQILRDGKPTINGVQLLFKGARGLDLSEHEAREYLSGKRPQDGRKVASYKGHPLGLK
jgi:hypothetical protein